MRFLAPATLLFAIAGVLLGQAPPHFDVATIKPANPNTPFNQSRQEGNGVSFRAMNLLGLIAQAYRDELGSYPQIEGGPDWIGKDRFDIVAQAPGPRDVTVGRAMLRQLLADRFGLKVHMETREQNVFALVPARQDAKLGPKVTPWNGTCFGNPAPTPPAGVAFPHCSAAMRQGLEIRGGTMAVVADQLSNPLTNLGRPVVDRTGITGEFDMDLTFDFFAREPADGPSLSTVLQEQWGLKLESAKAVLPVLVVDQATPPTEN